MDVHSLKVLQYDQVLDILGRYASSSWTRERIKRLTPSVDQKSIIEELNLVEEYRLLIDEKEAPPRPRVFDLREALDKSETLGYALESSYFLKIADAYRHLRELSSYLSRVKESSPRLYAVREKLKTDRGFEEEILRKIDEHGNVKDRASAELASIRSRINGLRDRIRTRIYGILEGLLPRDIVSDTVVTIRNNRLVIPVKTEAKNRVPGIMHDQSSSGATVFIEPNATVGMNNELAELQIKEKQEVHKILVDLTDKLRERAGMIQISLEALIKLDMVHCKAMFAEEYDCHNPAVTSERTFFLQKARHPLLVLQKIKEKTAGKKTINIVPTTLKLTPEQPVMLISGPNAGGKTVAQKTAGLIALMVQTGIPAPCSPDSVIPVFSGIFADIGDEQSIEESLSTFSGHMLRIKQFFQKADAHSLVLLDELGAGTDASEGSALGVAVLKEFIRRESLTIAVTHGEGIKNFAVTQSNIINASVSFDEEKLVPTYRLVKDKLGRSYGFQVAASLGMPQHIIEEAEKALDQETWQRLRLIEVLEKERESLAELRQNMMIKQQEIDINDERTRKLLKETEEKTKKDISEAREKGYRLIKDMKNRFEILFKNIQRQAKDDAEIKKTFQKEIDRARNLMFDRLAVPESKSPKKKQRLKKGDRVWVTSLNKEGRVETVEENKAKIRVGAVTVTLSDDELRNIRILAPQKDEEKREPEVEKKQADERVSIDFDETEINYELPMRLYLLGYRVEEAIRETDRYLDQAFRAGYPEVALIHGIGTGRLMRGLHQRLRKTPNVSSFRMGRPEEGGRGVTVVSLKRREY